MSSIILHWAHTLAAMIWIGGVAFIIFTILPSLKKTVDMSARQRIMGAMVPRFRAIVGGCLALLFITGVFNAWGKIDPSLFLATEYGRVFTIKMALVAVLFGLYFSAPLINRKFQNRECGHGASDACAHEAAPVVPAKKRPEIGIILHAVVFVIGVVVVFLGKMLLSAG